MLVPESGKMIILSGLVTILATCVLAGEDFYKLLGVSRGANDKEIRKAFKKLAVTMHPDKNVDDPDAHDNFIKINRAYEVLKDEELRKKYDMHGEEGLKEDSGRGQHYQSWRYYQEEFGIYDDDPEIITLSRADFETSVEGTEDVWFINYYSPHCSHCHTLAPTWREVARELEGVIRIGAVNCEDEWHLCRMQGIRSYPSLIIYPAREKFHGDKRRKELVKYALQHARVSVSELWSGNFDGIVGESDLPWLISFCGEGGDCVTTSTSLKLAGMLDELVSVGVMNCKGTDNEKKCEQLGHTHGTYLYELGKVEKGNELEITSLVAQEIANQVLAQLPDVTDLDIAMFQTVQDNLKAGDEVPWLIHFVEGEEGRHLELRKLHAILPEMNVGRVDCLLLREMCNDLHIYKFPMFLVFKPTGGYEIYYGRITAHDVAAFARDASQIKLEALNPKDFFEDRRVGSSNNDLWFVDFFAPWCPPCMRLLPEFRKAAKSYGEVVNFGTVDCTIHIELCRSLNINSYPTSILYNQTKPHKFSGHHDQHAIIEFIEDTLSPPVVTLDYTSFRRNVLQKKDEEIWMVDFYAPWCGPCNQLAPEWRRLAKKKDEEIWMVDFYAPWCGPCNQLAPEWRRLAKRLKGTKNINVGMVDCVEHSSLCQQQQVNSYPNVRLYPPNARGGSYHVYNGWHRDADSLRAWAFDFLPSKVETLTWNKFNKQVAPSSDAWIVDFYAPWCGHCQVFKPEFEKVANDIEGSAKAGKVDCTQERKLCQQAGVHSYPSVRFYPGSSSGQSQNYYGWDIASQNAEEITQFILENIPEKPRLKNKTRPDDEL